jgi:hypothetical protein
MKGGWSIIDLRLQSANTNVERTCLEMREERVTDAGSVGC